MCDQWMPHISLPLTIEQFRRLPRNPAYKYEYLDHQAFLSPHPQHYHAVLDLVPLDNRAGENSAVAAMAEKVPDPFIPDRLEADQLLNLAPLFAAAFRNIEPYGCLEEETRLEAARQALERTRSGGDGPFIQQASFVARQEGKPIGAILTTLLPDGDPCDWDCYHWQEAPPIDCIEHRLGQPHLTWVFVSPLLKGRSIGTALLAATMRELLAMGYKQLLSTFMAGNDSSMLWHWRCGFRLVTYAGSRRKG